MPVCAVMLAPMRSIAIMTISTGATVQTVALISPTRLLVHGLLISGAKLALKLLSGFSLPVLSTTHFVRKQTLMSQLTLTASQLLTRLQT